MLNVLGRSRIATIVVQELRPEMRALGPGDAHSFPRIKYLLFRDMLDSEGARQRLGRKPSLSAQWRYAVIVGRSTACSVPWLFSAPAEVESPDDRPQRTRSLVPDDALRYDPHCLDRAKAHE